MVYTLYSAGVHFAYCRKANWNQRFDAPSPIGKSSALQIEDRQRRVAGPQCKRMLRNGGGKMASAIVLPPSVATVLIVAGMVRSGCILGAIYP